MIEVVLRDRDIVEAVEIVHRVFAEDSGDCIEQLRQELIRRFPAWGDREVHTVMMVAVTSLH